jgi:pyridoxal phosphate enzyme (YggS family)
MRAMSAIAANVRAILADLPPGVELVAAAKTRTAAEILEAVASGVKIVGENYVQEAAAVFPTIGARARWHLIGHLQTNKVKRAVEFFDLVETVDSIGLGREIDKRAAAAGKTMEILVEINSGREPQKAGVMPDDAEALVRALAALPRLRVLGLMTMGPFEGDPEDSRPYFKETRRVFEALKSLALPGVEMRHLSMGMSHSWRAAVEEGATLVRIGTAIFGRRLDPGADL